MIKDKKNILKKLEEGFKCDLELGCGQNKKNDQSIGIDLLDYTCVDIVGDIFEVLKKIPTESINSVYTSHFFEHITEIDKLIKEIHRILVKNGKITIIVPHFSNPFYYSDFTHKVFFGLYSFGYYSKNNFKRSLPDYQNKRLFDQESVRLIFKSYRPRYIRHGLKKILEMIFNINTYMKEFYEENLTFIFSCYEISFTLKKI